MPKPMGPPLSRFLQASREFFRVDLYEFTLVGGLVLRYTNGDADIRMNGKLFSAGGIDIGPYVDTAGNRGRSHWGVGTTADTTMLDIVPKDATIGGVPFLTAVQQGVFDGALFRKYRVFMPTYGDTRRGPIIMFVGRVANADAGRSKATLTINSHLELLDQVFPRNVYQAGCVNNLGDTACGVNLAALAVACTVTSATAGIISANFTAVPTGRWNQGKVVFTSGVLEDMARTVKMATAGAPGTIQLMFPFPSAPQAGDTFNIFPGCDKTFAGSNGCPKFANTARWRGEDKIPIVETAI